MPFFFSPKNPVPFQMSQILFEKVNCEEPIDAPPSANLPIAATPRFFTVLKAWRWLFSQDCSTLLALQLISFNNTTTAF